MKYNKIIIMLIMKDFTPQLRANRRITKGQLWDSSSADIPRQDVEVVRYLIRPASLPPLIILSRQLVRELGFGCESERTRLEERKGV